MRPIKRRWNRVQSQIFVWAGEKPLHLKYSGFNFHVPGRHDIAKPGPGSIYTFESARDSEGRYVPGTLEVKDILHVTPEGGYTKTFDVDAACRFFDRDKNMLFEKGFQIVSNPGEIEVAMEDCIPLWEESEDERAQQILTTEMERQESFKAKGQDPPRSSSADQVAWAVAHLNRPGRKADRPDFDADDLKATLAGRAPEPLADFAAAAAKKARVPDEDKHPIPEKDVAANMRLYDEAREMGVKLSRSELAALLEDDHEMIGLVREKLEVKRKEAAEEAATS